MGIHMKNNINYTGATSLNTLRDVTIDSPATGQGIVWDEEKQQWTNGEVSTNDMVEITLAEYEALSTEEKNNDTTYFITDADNTDPGSVGTAGTLKPWLYDTENEVVIGVYDGKPLYRKIFNIDNIFIQNGTDWFDTGISWGDIENTIKGIIVDKYNQSFPTSIGWTDEPRNIAILLGSHIIALEAKQLIVEYTKTTDAEDSGTNLMPYSFVQNGGGGFKEPVYLYEGNLAVSGIEGTNITFDYNLSDYNWLYIGNNLADYPDQIYSHMIPISVLKMLNGKCYQSGHFSNESFIGITWVSENELKFVALGQYYTTTLFYIMAM